MMLNKERAHADHWKAQVRREQEELDRVSTLLKQVEGTVAEIQLTARGSEKGGAKHVAQRRELMAAIGRRNEAETKLLTLTLALALTLTLTLTLSLTPTLTLTLTRIRRRPSTPLSPPRCGHTWSSCARSRVGMAHAPHMHVHWRAAARAMQALATV